MLETRIIRESSLRWAFGAMIAMAAGGCGGRTPIEDCGPRGPVAFHRPVESVPCGNSTPGILTIATPEQWHAHCGPGEPTVDLSREIVVSYALEGDCAYSGCTEAVPLITAMTKHGCTLVVEVREVAPGELGPCRACVQPRDVVLVDQSDAAGVIELDAP
jgi:hypothetical protein